MKDNERYEYEKIITDLYLYIANQSIIIEKYLTYMDEIKVDFMSLKRESPLIMDENNPMIKIEKLSKGRV